MGAGGQCTCERDAATQQVVCGGPDCAADALQDSLSDPTKAAAKAAPAKPGSSGFKGMGKCGINGGPGCPAPM
jgi:hypothetical protein